MVLIHFYYKFFRYDHVLEFGLPSWQQPVYYYRKYKKLGLLEAFTVMTVTFSVGHFIVIWVAYLEQKFEIVSSVFSYFTAIFLTESQYFALFLERSLQTAQAERSEVSASEADDRRGGGRRTARGNSAKRSETDALRLAAGQGHWPPVLLYTLQLLFSHYF